MASETYQKLKALLDEKKTLTKEDIDKFVAEHGDMTDEEKMQLEADRLEAEKSNKEETITMEQYLEACKVLDTAEEGSDEYKKAEAIVNKYESGM
ncbi:MAG: hypothetical protein CUN56_02915 [Phototrophicales bacterium]|nr:MAG: hypothetical protein CUN56_02915 [Phototrophicales bacterium]RMG70840.1 MAG: hypothetical protein D6711_16475 [Chloroflexota bacterium]